MESTWLLDSPSNCAAAIAKGLLQIRAVELRPSDPFTWSSGWKSPIYCDNRLILGYTALWRQVIRGFEDVVKMACPGVNLIAGTATAGIPHAAILADRLGLPMAYVRSSAKGHGKQKRVEGSIYSGARAIVIEDTLSTGGSSFSAVEALRDEGVEVLAVATIFSYDFDVAKGRASDAQVPVYRLLDYHTLIREAVAMGAVSDSDVDALMAWRDAPDRYAAPNS